MAVQRRTIHGTLETVKEMYREVQFLLVCKARYIL